MNAIFARVLCAAAIAGIRAFSLAAIVSESPSVVVERGPHHQLIQKVLSVIDEAGRSQLVTNSYVQLENGLNYQDENGVWQDSSAEIELGKGVAVVRKAQFQLTFSADVSNDVVVDLTQSDGKRLRSRVLGLAYVDVGSGQSILIAEVKPSEGLLVGSNQIIYPDAFTDLIADVRYTVTKQGLEQDVLLRQQPPPPEKYGLNSGTTKLQVLTEFVDPPTPKKTETLLANDNPALNAASVEHPALDESLDFGEMTIGTGRAFTLGEEGDPTVPVAKQWLLMRDTENNLDRNILIEAVDFNAIQPHLDALPPSPDARLGRPASLLRRTTEIVKAGRIPQLPIPRPSRPPAEAQFRRANNDQLLAINDRPAFVLDYIQQLSSGMDNYTFRGDYTYYITGPITMGPTMTTIEGGAVIKFDLNAKLTVSSPLTWKASVYRPVVFTAKDDQSCGERISGSASGASTTYASIALELTGNVAYSISHLRIAYATTAIKLPAANTHTLSHLQIVNCTTGILPSTGTTFNVRNALFSAVSRCFGGAGASGAICNAQHLTVNGISNFNYNNSCSTMVVVNSLLVIPAGGAGTLTAGSDTFQTTSASGLFQTALAGSYYLADNSVHRNAGTGAINSDLQKELKTMTTFPPYVFQGTVTSDVYLVPQAARDSDSTLDRGYHYPPLDYVLNNVNVNNGRLILTNGVALGGYGTKAILLIGGGKVVGEGLPQQLNRLVTFNVVQEQPSAFIDNTAAMTFIEGNDLNLRFTDVSFLADSTLRRALCSNAGFNGARFIKDSQLRGVSGTFNNSAGGSPILTFQNNLCERSIITFTQGYNLPTYPGSLVLIIQNNLFSYSSLYLEHFGDYYGSWSAYDNLFDNATVLCTEYGLPPYSSSAFGSAFTTRDYNGFIQTTNPFGAPGDRNSLTRDFTSIPLSSGYAAPAGFGQTFYYGANLATLVNADTTRSPSGLGLLHYTTQSNQQKETSWLDIGFHYVALNSSGMGNDQDGDGLADYYEDRNGNGLGDGGLVGYWNCNEASGSRVADTSWNLNHGTIQGNATRGSGKSGNGISFAQAADGVSIPHSDRLHVSSGGAITVAFWVKKIGESVNSSRIVGKGGNGVRNYGIWDNAGADKRLIWQMYMQDGSTPTYYSQAQLNVGTWYHVAWSYNGGTATLYVNGVLDGSSTPVPGSPVVETDPLTIGYPGWAGAETFLGTLDELRVYNRALSATEVATIYSTIGLEGESDTVVGDSDGDGMSDGLETQRGSNPLRRDNPDWQLRILRPDR